MCDWIVFSFSLGHFAQDRDHEVQVPKYREILELAKVACGDEEVLVIGHFTNGLYGVPKDPLPDDLRLARRDSDPSVIYTWDDFLLVITSFEVFEDDYYAVFGIGPGRRKLLMTVGGFGLEVEVVDPEHRLKFEELITGRGIPYGQVQFSEDVYFGGNEPPETLVTIQEANRWVRSFPEGTLFNVIPLPEEKLKCRPAGNCLTSANDFEKSVAGQSWPIVSVDAYVPDGRCRVESTAITISRSED